MGGGSGWDEDLSAVGTEAREVPIEEAKGAEFAPKAAEALIDEEITTESTPEAHEASIEEEKAALAEVPDAVESATLEAPIGGGEGYGRFT